jgi:hypothetical protein
MSYLKFSFSGYPYEPKFENVLEAIENSKKTRLESYGRNDYAFIGEDMTIRSMNNGRWLEDVKEGEYARNWSELLISECGMAEDGKEDFLSGVSLGFVCIDNYYEFNDEKTLKLFFEGIEFEPTIRHVEEAMRNVYQREVMGGLHIGKNKYNTTWIEKQEDGTWIDRDDTVWGSLYIAEVDKNGTAKSKIGIGLTRLSPGVHALWF